MLGFCVCWDFTHEHVVPWTHGDNAQLAITTRALKTSMCLKLEKEYTTTTPIHKAHPMSMGSH